jgi:adenylate kinase
MKLIFICGCRGSGKTTHAKYLAEELGLTYLQYSQFNIDQAIKRWGYLDWGELSTAENADWINNQFIKRVAEELKSNNVIIDGHLSYYESSSFSTQNINALFSSAKTLVVLVSVPEQILAKRIAENPRDRKLSIRDIKIDSYSNKQLFDKLQLRNTTTLFKTVCNLELHPSQLEFSEIVKNFLVAE